MKINGIFSLSHVQNKLSEKEHQNQNVFNLVAPDSVKILIVFYFVPNHFIINKTQCNVVVWDYDAHNCFSVIYFFRRVAQSS